jgi:hypothetical protein
MIIEELKSNPETTREARLEKLSTSRPARNDQERAINIIVGLNVALKGKGQI